MGSSEQRLLHLQQQALECTTSALNRQVAEQWRKTAAPGAFSISFGQLHLHYHGIEAGHVGWVKDCHDMLVPAAMSSTSVPSNMQWHLLDCGIQAA